MWADIIDLRDFYQSGLGRAVVRAVEFRLQRLWSRSAGQRILGIGFATPYLDGYVPGSERTIAVMPAGQGVLRWPADGAGLVALADEATLPLPDRSIDRIVMVHCLEGAAEVRAVLRECWRVLADGGRLIVVVANRSGFWARADRAPFAHGRPFSMGQITRLLRDSMFVPLASDSALFMPPFWWRAFGARPMWLENLGLKLFPAFAGVLIIKAEKQIYAAPFDGAPVRGAHAVVASRAAPLDPA